MSAIFSSRPAIDLLFRVMETRGTQIAGATLTEYFPRAAETLLASGLLMPHGHVPVVAAMDAYEDEPMQAVWSAEHKSYGYLNSVGRWVRVDEREIAAYRVDYGRTFTTMLVPFERHGPAKPVALIADHLWDIGTIRIPGAKAPVPVWFGRRLGDPQIWAKIAGFAERRPATEMRVILTSTRGDRLPMAPDRRHALVAVSDVLEAADGLTISPQILAARVFPDQVQRRQPIDHSEDFGIVWLRDETFMFRGDKQRRLLEQLFGAYWAGSPVCRTSAVLFEAGYEDKTNSLAKAFGKREDWRQFIKYDDGNCWIDP